mgnify:CR=1 FL=1
MAAKKRTKRRTMFQETWHRLLKNKGAVIGMAFLALLCVIRSGKSLGIQL